MGTEGDGTILHYLRRLTPPEGAAADGDLLARFAAARDGAAFEALVRRHGPLVWGVCFRVLADPTDAEDAFQATFLVLARRAAAVGRRELLANWLYGVARRTALKARGLRARRRRYERQVAPMPEPSAANDVWAQVRPDLDAELARLADKYRLPVLLCYLRGLTRNEAAEALGWPPGTVAGRLARALDLLRARLARRGVVLTAGALAAVLVENAAAAVPPHLVRAVTRAAPLVAAAGITAAGVSATVVALTQGALKPMSATKIVLALTALLALGLLASGAAAVAPALLGGGPTPTAAAPGAPAEEPAPPPAETKEKPPAQPKKPPRLKADEALAILRDYLQYDKRALPYLDDLRVKELTTDPMWDKLGAQLFRTEPERGVPLCNVYAIRNKEVYPLHADLAGFRLRSFCVADLRGDGKPLLVYSYTWGSGVSRAQVAALDVFAKEPKPVIAAQSLWLDPAHDWDVKTDDGKSIRVEGGGVAFGDLVYQEKDGKASLRIKLRDDVPPRLKQQVKEK